MVDLHGAEFQALLEHSQELDGFQRGHVDAFGASDMDTFVLIREEFHL